MFETLIIGQDTAVALDGLEHNFYFTLELHTTFVYKSLGPWAADVASVRFHEGNRPRKIQTDVL